WKKASESQARSLRPRPQILFLNTESWFLTEFTPASWCSTAKKHPAAINIGVAPTYNVNRRRVEIHLLDWKGDLYGKNLAVELVGFIRKERTFADGNALKKQIFSDIATIRELLGKSDLF
ncbi:MAG: riboflavin kinase, partial [Lentisphaeria bacterium]|nr:riboflavin kinase [Lentisphaeria bacterium]